MAVNQLYRVILLFVGLVSASTGYSQINSLQSNTSIQTLKMGSTVILHGKSEFAVAYQWYRDGTKIDGAINENYNAVLPGIYNVVAYNSENCSSAPSDNIKVILSSPPVKQDSTVDLAVNIESTESKVVPGENLNYVVEAFDNSYADGTNVEVNLMLSSKVIYIPQPIGDSAVTYDPLTKVLKWKLSTLKQREKKVLNVSVSALQSGTISNTVQINGYQKDPNLNNNISTITQEINPLTIPNVFTPNGDGVNDTFSISGLNAYSETELLIINKAGRNIYNMKNYQNNWDGDGQAEGTYFYILKVKTSVGDWNVYKGYLTLLRSKV